MLCNYFIDLRDQGSKQAGREEEKENAVNLSTQYWSEARKRNEKLYELKGPTRSPSVLAAISPAVSNNSIRLPIVHCNLQNRCNINCITISNSCESGQDVVEADKLKNKVVM